MQPAVFIARLVGPLFVVIGIGILLNEPIYAGMIVRGGAQPDADLLVRTAGAAPPASPCSTCYRAWTADWRVIITILGWLMRDRRQSSASCCRQVDRRCSPTAISIPDRRRIAESSAVIVLVRRRAFYRIFEGIPRSRPSEMIARKT